MAGHEEWYGVQTEKGWVILETEPNPAQYRLRAALSTGGTVFIFDKQGNPMHIKHLRRGHEVRIYQVEELVGVKHAKELANRGKSLGEVIHDKPIRFENFPERLAR